MDSLEKKTFEVSRGFTYTYYTSPARDALPTIMMFHGWPDTAELWEGVIIDYLKPAGYGVVAVDCLGYAGTSKPTDYKAYNHQHMSKDAMDILDHEKLDKIVSLGHDWGCALAQRLYNYHADRVIGLVMINVSLMEPTPEPFDLDKTIALTKQIFGYGTFWYWKVFGSDDGWKLLDSRIESMWTIGHGKPESFLETLCTEDGVKNFLEEDRRQPTEDYATDEMRDKFIARMKRDGFQAPQNWYRSMMHGEQDIANKAVPKENITINIPTLFFGGSRDMVCRPELLGPSVEAGLLPQLKTVIVDAGHWSILAKPKEFGEALTGWLKDNF